MVPLAVAFLASSIIAIDPLPAGAVQRLGSPRYRHGTEIVSSALSPDGKILATAGTRGVIVWDVATGRRLHTFPTVEITASPADVTFSPTGKRLAICRHPADAQVRDTITGRLEWDSHQAKVAFPTFCRFGATDDEFLVASSVVRKDESSFVKLETRTLPTGALTAARECDPSWQYAVPPGGRFAIRQGQPNHCSVLEWGTDRVLAIADGWRPAAISPNGERMVWIKKDGSMELIPTRAGPATTTSRIPETFKRRNPDGYEWWVVNVGFSDDGREVWVGRARQGDDAGSVAPALRAIHRWDAVTGKELPLLAGHGHLPSGVHYFPDGKSILTTGQDGTIRFWDRATGRTIGPEPDLGGHPAFSADGSTFGIATGGKLGITDLNTGARRQFATQLNSPIAFALSPDGSSAACRTYECAVHLFDAKSGTVSRILSRDPSDRMVSLGWLRFSPDGTAIAATGRWDTRVWNVKTGRSVRREGDGPTTFIGNGRGLVVSSTTGFEVRDTYTSIARRTLPVIAGNPNSLAGGVDIFAVSPDGRWGATGDDGGQLVLQDMTTGNLIHRLPVFPYFPIGIGGSPYRPSALAFSADSKWLAVGTSTHAVEVWEVASGARLNRFDGHDTAVRVVQFAADGRTLWSAGNDGLAYRWEVLPRSRTPLEWGQVWVRLTHGAPADVPSALRTVIDDPTEAISFLRKTYSPPTRRDREQLARVVEWLGDDDFATREQAEEDAFRVGVMAIARLQAAARDPNPERSVRAARVLNRLGPEDRAAALRAGRVVAALELAGTADARGLLEEWSRSASEEHLVAEAKAAIERRLRLPPSR